MLDNPLKSTELNCSRREFLQDALVIGGVTSAFASIEDVAKGATGDSRRIRIGVVGTGNRLLSMWGPPVEKEYSSQVEFVGLCDLNGKRASYAQSQFASKPPIYTDFKRLLHETSPNTILVTSIDATHVPLAIAAMEHGCDVICEKPVATTAKHCQMLYDSQKLTGRNVTVAFNARYFVEATKIKELLLSGVIGELYSVDYAELLDLRHGADYFRRWHALKKNSGTLLCHKSSHQFDQVNWWVNSQPEVVTAFGNLNEYGREGPFSSTHCRKCDHHDKCQFYWDIATSPRDMKLYVENEDVDGYLRDACVYRPDVDIYDTMSLQCRYKNGVLLNYSLNATSPVEGQIVAINGSKGRIEMRSYNQQPWKPESKAELRLITHSPHHSEQIPLAIVEGEHGGADAALKEQIFDQTSKDPLGHRAGVLAGVYSSLIGIAGYLSIESNNPVRIEELFKVT